MADADREKIVKAANRMWDTSVTPSGEFGDGHAANIIIDSIVRD